ncbi:MAG TPA: PEP-CTERM sorting domain-containing protein [Stellaceae bacterium]|nr:PEP-CTERM sorting domain-containing protein [Stellaceae bacterium]
MKKEHRFVLLSAALLLALSAGTAWAGVIAVAVPEPSSLALLATAIGGLAWKKFRGRK